MNNSKHTTSTVGSGESRIKFDTPQDPFEIHLFEAVPYDARITSIDVRYVRVPREVIDADRKKANAEFEAKLKRQKRHEAAIKANATRKAKKKEGGKQ